jgi:MGT family glycosyltransferase
MAGTSKFLFTVWPYPGHVHPNVAIAHALDRRGYETAFYTGGSLAASLEGEGFRCFPFRHVDEARVEAIVLALDALSLQWWRARRRKALLREWLLGTVEAQLQDLAAVIDVWRPDVLVCDPAMWGPLLVLQETARIPLAVMSYVAACMLPGPEGPIVGLPLPRARGPLARGGRRVLRSAASVVAADVRREAEAIRARHGLAPMGMSVTAFSGRMPLYLLPSTPAYDRQRRDLPPSVRYVGPCHWDKPGTAPPAPWLAALPRDRPVIYVTEGTMHSKPPMLLRAALKGLAPLAAQVIATTGKHRDPESLGLGAVPPNARVEQWVPHSDLLPRTDVVVTTGGTGTVLATLCAGVPLVVVPTAWDQPENAWRVAEAGAGIRLSPGECTPEGIRLAVERVLSDPSFRQNASRLGADFATYGGAAQAADLLEELANHRATRGDRDLTAGPRSLSGNERVRQTAEDHAPPPPRDLAAAVRHARQSVSAPSGPGSEGARR